MHALISGWDDHTRRYVISMLKIPDRMDINQIHSKLIIQDWSDWSHFNTCKLFSFIFHPMSHSCYCETSIWVKPQFEYSKVTAEWFGSLRFELSFYLKILPGNCIFKKVKLTHGKLTTGHIWNSVEFFSRGKLISPTGSTVFIWLLVTLNLVDCFRTGYCY